MKNFHDTSDQYSLAHEMLDLRDTVILVSLKILWNESNYLARSVKNKDQQRDLK